MRYIDSGTRDVSQAFGTWLRQAVGDEVVEVRFQSGFFGSDSLTFLQPTLNRLSANQQTARALVGSNDQCTIRRDIEQLVIALGIPRERALLGVVSYQQGYYHPKTVHVRRADGSQAGYVGSANLTGSGAASLHVEAGITLDTREQDSEEVLELMAAAVDNWFEVNPPGLYRVSSVADIDQLVRDRIIAERPPPRPATPRAGRQRGQGHPPMSRLQPLIQIPRRPVSRDAGEVLVEAADIRRIILPATPRAGFPHYLLFAAENVPTLGVTALSGSSLPNGVSGLIIRLNRDSGRHFIGRPGTANISLPVASLTTLRFGRMPGGSQRPRAQFSLRLRYLTSAAPITLSTDQTNVMAYGFEGDSSGHRDVRMLVPASVRQLAQQIRNARLPVPREGDAAILEWPSVESAYEFRLSFLQRGTQLFQEAQTLLNTAFESGTTVGAGACWLPYNLAPAW